MKPGILIEIPGFGNREIHTIVCDYNGTLSCGGRLTPGIREKLVALLDFVDIRIVSSDSFGTATEELRGIVRPGILNAPPKVEPPEHEPIEEQARGPQLDPNASGNPGSELSLEEIWSFSFLNNVCSGIATLDADSPRVSEQ